MKILLTTRNNSVYDDYKVVIATNPKQLDEIGIDHGELEGLALDSVLDRIPLDKIEDAFQYFARKVKVGGELVVMGVDFTSVARSYTNFSMNIVEVNQRLFGGKQQSVLSKDTITSLFNKVGYKVYQEYVSDNQYIVKGIRQ